MRPFSYSFEKRYVAPSRSVRISSPFIRAICCEKSAANGMERERHSSVWRSIALRVVRADQHQVEAADALGDGLQLDEAGLAHGARVEGADLVVVGVRGADETGRVQDLGDADGVGVHAVPVEPGAVLVEVGARGADQDRVRAELPHAERDVRADTAPADVEVVDEEGEGDRVQLIRDQLVGEAAGEGHEVVGGDGAGDCDTHGVVTSS